MRLPRPHRRPPQTCSLRISKQLVEKVLLMRIFHLCSGPCVPCWDLRWDTKHEKWETFHQTFQTVHILAQHNNNITDSWSENKSNTCIIITVYFLVMRLSQKSVCARQAANRITHGVMESAAAEHQQQHTAQHVLSPWRVVRHVMAVKTMKSGSGKGSYKYYYN